MQKQELNTIAITIWTPLHLFNALRFVITNDLIGRCDAYFICQSESAHDYMNNAVQTGMFRRVFSTTRDMFNRHQKMWEGISAALSPKLYVSHLFGTDAINNHYKQLLFSVPTRLNDAIILANNCDEVVGLDDGIGSYMADLMSTTLGKKYELVKKIRRSGSYSVNKVLLNNPEFCVRGSEYRFSPLLARSLTKEERDSLNRIFLYSEYSEYPRFIYLNQPILDMKDSSYLEIETEVVSSLLETLRNDLIVRLHPREVMKDVYQGALVDNGKEMWEIMWNDTLSNDNVLIACFSTAQFTPHLLFRKEPFLIFTYHLYNGFTDGQIKSFNDSIEALKRSYVNKQKIYVPNSKADLKRILNKIISSSLEELR